MILTIAKDYGNFESPRDPWETSGIEQFSTSIEPLRQLRRVQEYEIQVPPSMKTMIHAWQSVAVHQGHQTMSRTQAPPPSGR